MFYWIIYFLSVFVGLNMADFFWQMSFGFPSVPHAIDEGESLCFLGGTVITTIYFAIRIKHFKAYRHLPFICFIGFFSWITLIALISIPVGLVGLVEKLWP